MDLLPQMSPKDLYQRNLQCWDFAVHEDACQVQLHLKSNVDVCTIDGGRPPQSESPIRDLVQTGSLRIRQLLVLHAFLRTNHRSLINAVSRPF